MGRGGEGERVVTMYMLCCPAETASDSAGVWGKEHCPWPGAGDSLQRGIHPSTGTGDCQPFSGGEEAGCEHTNLRCHSYCVLIIFPPSFPCRQTTDTSPQWRTLYESRKLNYARSLFCRGTPQSCDVQLCARGRVNLPSDSYGQLGARSGDWTVMANKVACAAVDSCTDAIRASWPL